MPTTRNVLLAGGLALLAACAQSPPREPGLTGTYDVRHEVKITMPEGAHRARLWFALPQDDPAQDISGLTVESPFPHRIERDSEGNKVLYCETTDSGPREFSVVTRFVATRREIRTTPDPMATRPLTAAENAEFSRYLAPNQNVVIDDSIRTLGAEITAGETNPVRAARRIYDWELDNVDYWVKDPKTKKASPVGSSEYCLANRTGNCTDFHSLWAALARSQHIPTRIVYGVFLKKELDGQDVDSSYHCWPEFYAPGIGWIPHDVAVADIFAGSFPVTAENETLVRRTTADGYSGPDPAKVAYYFGNLDHRRITFSIGRDLRLSPPPAAGRINALPKAYVEIDGQPGAEKTAWTRKLTYTERRAE